MADNQKRRRKHFFGAARTLATILIFATRLVALQFGHDVSQYGHTSWTRQDGRLPGGIYSLTQSTDGSLWVGTEFGLFRFDGVRFSPWKPPAGKRLLSNVISAMAAAPDGGLWLGTRSGLSYWRDQQLRNYATPKGSGVSSIVADQSGTVWVGTAGFKAGGLCIAKADSLTCNDVVSGYDGGSVLALSEDKAGNLWIGSEGGVYRYSSAGRGSSAAGLYHYGKKENVQALAQAPDGGLVFASPSGLLEINGEHPKDYTNDQTIRGAHTITILRDRAGALWIGTTGSGLLHLYQGRVDRFASADGLSGDTVFSLFEDREGDVWAATDRGLDRFRDLPVTTMTSRQGLSSGTVQSVSAADQGGVWIGTTEGVDHVVIDHVAGRATLPFQGAGSLFEDRSGTLWVDSIFKGLAFVQAGAAQWLQLPNGRHSGPVAAIAEGRDDSLWFADVSNGLVRLRGHSVVKVISWDQFGHKTGKALAVDSGNGGLFIGFAEGGIAHLDENNDRPDRWYAAPDGLGSGAVNDLRFDNDGTVWAATDGGLSELKNGRIATLTPANGLPCEQIQAMAEDDDHNLWLATECGLVQLTRKDLAAWSASPGARVTPTVFGPQEGFQPHPTNYGYFRRAVKSSDGRLWFPEFDGVAVVDPHHLPRNPLPPPVKIDSVTTDRTINEPRQEVTLRHFSQGLTIDYTAFSFVEPDRVRFKYKLTGYDATWIDAGERRQALYPNLGHGHYFFQVIAGNNDEVWNETGASLVFNIQAAFYQTWWFRLLSAALLAGVLWAVYRMRMRQLEVRLALRFEERLRERTRISRELHDTLLQNISGLALQLDGLSKVAGVPDRDQIRGLRRQVEGWLREVRESLWELRNQDPGDTDLAAAIERAGAAAKEKGISFRVRSSGDSRALDTRIQRNLLGIVQEAVRNAAAHSQATEIEVSIWYPAEDRMRIEISDNGRGFDQAVGFQKQGHWGMATMRERAQEIDAEFTIDAFPGGGVRIVIWAPLREAGVLRDE